MHKGLTALSQFRLHDPELKLQINLSPLQFADRQLAVTILRMVAEHGLPSSALTVELTEGAMLLYPEQVEQTMRQFVDAGVSLHLDDFGTGYASLNYLRSFPFDGIKLDKSFIMAMGDSESAKNIVEKIIGLGKEILFFYLWYLLIVMILKRITKFLQMN